MMISRKTLASAFSSAVTSTAFLRRNLVYVLCDSSVFSEAFSALVKILPTYYIIKLILLNLVLEPEPRRSPASFKPARHITGWPEIERKNRSLTERPVQTSRRRSSIFPITMCLLENEKYNNFVKCT